ncbi:MAG: Shedu anti-phage system protein SduA domain-containing protein [Bacteroidia bacterium]
MKSFETVSLNSKQFERELSDFRNLLDSSDQLDERKTILPFFRTRKQLCSFIGAFYVELNNAFEISFEKPLTGDFKSDLIVGDAISKKFLFVEFESAKPNSIFETRNSRYYKKWSTSIEKAYSQFVDWFWKIERMKRSNDLYDFFGNDLIDYLGLLVIGRDKFFTDKSDEERFIWRRENFELNGKRIFCVTYDQLYKILSQRLESLKLIGKE